MTDAHSTAAAGLEAEPGSKSRALDAVDEALVEALEANGREPYEQLARQVGLSRPAVAARVQRLLDDKTISVAGVVHPSVFGISHYAHVAVQVDGPVAPVADIAADSVDAVFVSLVSGRFALVAEIRASTESAVAEHIQRIRSAPRVRSVESSPYTSIVKDRNVAAPSVPPTHYGVDELDLDILRILQEDGRATYTEVAARVGLSAGAARSRVLQLISSGVVRIDARSNPGPLANHQHLGFGLEIRDSGEALAELASISEIYFLATTLGRRDVLGTLVARNSDDALAVADRIRAIPGIVDLELWWHMRYLKDTYSS
jgi:DNA-binding Lrp family transcriptional regulator